MTPNIILHGVCHMSRWLSVSLAAALLSSFAQAHFPFILPGDNGQQAIVIFSDTLEADANVNMDKLSPTKLFLRNASGQDQPLEWSKGEHSLMVPLPPGGGQVIHGVTDYGVLQRGEGKPFRLIYYPKAILGPVRPQAPSSALARLEVLPIPTEGKVQFQVLAEGKPLPECEVTVLLPGGGRQGVKTDTDGRTPLFEAKGRYGVVARMFENTVGEKSGLKFEQVRHYATLVVDVPSAK